MFTRPRFSPSAVTANEAGRLEGTIFALRLSRGLTHGELAAWIPVLRNCVGTWKRGVPAPPLTLLAPLCGTLGVRADIWTELSVRRVERSVVDGHTNAGPGLSL